MIVLTLLIHFHPQLQHSLMGLKENLNYGESLWATSSHYSKESAD